MFRSFLTKGGVSMREHKEFFGVPLTEEDCLGWALRNSPFEIIVNRTRGEVRVVMTDWLKAREPLTRLACLFAALADRAEKMAAVERPFQSGLEKCDGGPGLAPPCGGLADQEIQYFTGQFEAKIELEKLFDILPEIIEACVKVEREAEIYHWLKSFFHDAASYWPQEFEEKQAAMLRLLEADAFAESRRFDELEPSKVKDYVNDVGIELFKVMFSLRHRPEYAR